MSSIDEKISLAKAIILTSSSLRLFGCLFYKFEINVVDCEDMTAMAYKYRNDKNIKIAISRQFIDTLKSANEVVYILLHEISHILSNHLSRGLHLDQAMYNIASDHVINTALDSDVNSQRLKGIGIPKDRILITSLHNQNMSTEEVYHYLMDHAEITTESYEISFDEDASNESGNNEGGQESDKGQPQEGNGQSEEGDGEGQKQGQGKGPGKIQITGQKIHVKLDDGQEFTTYKDFHADSSDVENAEKSIQDDARRLLNSPLFEAEKKKGSKASNTMELIQEAIRVEIPWDQLLENVIKSNITERSDNKTWARVNKRMYAYNMILPYTDDEEIYDNLLVIVDTSGSVSTYELQKFTHILKAAMIHFKKVIKIDHDYVIYDKHKTVYDSSTIDNLTKDIRVEYTGRGGTSHSEVYQYIEAVYEGDNTDIPIPGLILFLTDFESDIESIHHNFKWVKEIPFKYIISTREKFPVNPEIDKSPIFIIN